MVEVDHQEGDRVVVTPGALHLLQEPLGQVAAVGQLGELICERVLLLGLEQLGVANRDCGLRSDSVQKVRLVVAELAPGVEVELHGTHQLPRALDGDDQRVLRMTPRLQAWGRVLVEVDDQRPHHRQDGLQRFLVDLPHAAPGPVGEVVRRLAVHLGLAGSDQVHRAGDRAHDPAGVGQGDVEHLFEGKRRVDGGGYRQEQGRPVAGAALVGQRGLELARRPAQAHQGDGQQDEGENQQDRNDEQYAGELHRGASWF